MTSGLHTDTQREREGGGTRHVGTHLFQDRRITENLKLTWVTVGFGASLGYILRA